MDDILSPLGLSGTNPGTFVGSWLHDESQPLLTSISPIDGCQIARVTTSSSEQYEFVLQAATNNSAAFHNYPAPKRGEIIREVAEQFRKHKAPLAKLISVEMGKIYSEALGEVQEAIDIADFAVGLSRQLHGLTMHSERTNHRMYEQWHPLGNVAVITAFNFPMAVWAWNAMIAAVCGNSVVWKGSELTPLTSVAVTRIVQKVAARHGFPALFTLLTGDGASIGQKMAQDRRFPLVSATGSCRMGRSVAQVVGNRLGKSLLELGGNNAIIVLKDANLQLAERAVLFGAVGTAGQRCTSTRRLIIEKPVEAAFIKKLLKSYASVKIGHPLQPDTLMGPLVGEEAVRQFQAAVKLILEQGGKVLYGGNVLKNAPSAYYVEPTLVQAHKDMPLIREETFAPILYVLGVDSLDEAIELNNSVAQGLSSAIFTDSLQAAEKFLSAGGSDCGIANVNIGTSGAEIGGAFGGEKDTGGGREAGSDSWKAYMRRQTTTINWGDDLPLAQGVKF